MCVEHKRITRGEIFFFFFFCRASSVGFTFFKWIFGEFFVNKYEKILKYEKYTFSKNRGILIENFDS